MNHETNRRDINKEEALEFLLKKNEDRILKKRLLEEFNSSNSTKTNSRKFSSLGIAAIIFLLVGLGLYAIIYSQQQVEPPRLMAEKFIAEAEFDDIELVRGNSTNLNQQLIELYNQKNYSEIIIRSKNVETKNSDELKFILSVAHLKTKGDYSKVIDLTDELILSGSYLKAEALWMNTLALLKTEEYDRAENKLDLLQKIGYKVKEATQILKAQK